MSDAPNAVKIAVQGAVEQLPLAAAVIKELDPLPPPTTGEASTHVSDNPGVATQDKVSDLPPAPSAVSAILDEVVEMLNKRPILSGTDGIPQRIAVGFRGDRTLITATRDNEEHKRYPNLGSNGVFAQVYRYDNANAAAGDLQAVTTAVGWDLDCRWYVELSTTIAGRKVTASAWLAGALNPAEETPALISQFARFRGFYFDGKVALSLTEKALNRSATSGYSSLSCVVKLQAYLASIAMPADDGTLGVCSIPAGSPLAPFGNYFPHSGQSVAALGVIPSFFISLEGFNNVLNGNTVLPNGFSVANIGSSVSVIPVQHSRIGQGGAIAWSAVSQMQYPVRDVQRTGVARDWNGDLTVNGQPAQFNWYPATTLLSIPGQLPTNDGNNPPVAVNNSALIIFVLVEDYPSGNMSIGELSFPGGVVLPFHSNLEPAAQAAVDFAPVLNHLFGADFNNQASNIEVALSLVSIKQGGFADLRDGAAILASHCNFSRLVGERGSGNNRARVNPTLLVPEHSGSDDRGFVDAADELPIFNAANVRIKTLRPYGLITNSVGMYPGISWNAQGVPVNEHNVSHYSIAPYDPIMGVALAAGLLVLPEVSEDIPVPFNLGEQGLHTVTCSYQVALATDAGFAANGIPRCLLWDYLQANNPGFENLSNMMHDFWGQRGLPILEETCTFGVATSKWLFDGRVLLHYPTNGVMFHVAAATPAVYQQANGDLLLTRFDHATIKAEFPSFGEVSTIPELDLQSLPWSTVTRNAQRTRKDVVCRIPEAFTGNSEDFLQGWKISRRLDGLMANNMGVGVYNSLAITPSDMPGIQYDIATQYCSPATWGGLLSLGTAAEVQQYIVFSPTTWVLTFVRPLLDASIKQTVPLTLRCNDKTTAYSCDRFVQWKPVFYATPAETRWSGLPEAPVLKRFRAIRL